MKQVSYCHNEIFIGEETICVKQPILRLVHFDLVFVVLLAYERNDTENRNVLAFDYEGNMVWKIPPPHVLLPPSYPHPKSCPYHEMHEYECSGKLAVYNSNYNRYIINPDTGEILEKEAGRW